MEEYPKKSPNGLQYLKIPAQNNFGEWVIVIVDENGDVIFDIESSVFPETDISECCEVVSLHNRAFFSTEEIKAILRLVLKKLDNELLEENLEFTATLIS